jgi:hypothetical protein
VEREERGKMSHTKGPWSMRERYIRILDSTVTLDVFAVTANRGEDTVCEIPMGDDSTAEANARLIAASPELLETLKEAQVRIFMADGSSELYERIRVLLNKIEGRKGK